MTTTVQDATAATPPTSLPVACPAWCTSTTGHAEARHVEDQWHTGLNHQVTLSREGLVDCGRTFELEHVSCQAESEDGPDGPFYVRLAVGDDIGIKLTRGETLALSDALSRSAESIDPDGENVEMSRGEALRDAREMLNISIEDFAAHMDESPAVMRAYEAGVYMTRQTASLLNRALARTPLNAARQPVTA